MRKFIYFLLQGVQGGCDGTECDTLPSRHHPHIASGGGSGSSHLKSGTGASCASYNTAGPSSMAAAENSEGTAKGGANNSSEALRETHSCPSSPTETECSSGFSTLRRRSVTLTEKVEFSMLWAGF